MKLRIPFLRRPEEPVEERHILVDPFLPGPTLERLETEGELSEEAQDAWDHGSVVLGPRDNVLDCEHDVINDDTFLLNARLRCMECGEVRQKPTTHEAITTGVMSPSIIASGTCQDTPKTRINNPSWIGAALAIAASIGIMATLYADTLQAQHRIEALQAYQREAEVRSVLLRTEAQRTRDAIHSLKSTLPNTIPEPAARPAPAPVVPQDEAPPPRFPLHFWLSL